MVEKTIDAVFLGGFSLLYEIAVKGFKRRKSDTNAIVEDSASSSTPFGDPQRIGERPFESA